MPLYWNGTGCARAALMGAALLAGCASPAKQARDAPRGALPEPPHTAIATGKPVTVEKAARARVGEQGITTVHHEEPAESALRPLGSGDELFSGQSELSLPELVSEVQRRNPSLQAALAAWGAASQRYPQVVALEDPVLQSMFAPGSFSSSSNVQASYFVGIAQKVPWAGKRALRGQIAQAEADAAGLDSQDVRLRLTEATRLAFLEYYLVDRDRELNRANIDAVGKFRDTAKAKFEGNQVPQQDLLQADVELALLESRRIELDQNAKIVVARINTLLHREPQLPLPPPPPRLEIADGLPQVDSLRQMALDQRPDLAAQLARIEAEQASVALAMKEFYPDFEIMGRYDQFWTDVVQRSQAGLYFNIPLNQSRRQAAVCEAMFRASKLKAEYDAQVDAIRSDVEAGYARLEGSHKNVRLYDKSLLPAAQENVASAYTGYEAGTVDFLRLVAAERQLIELQEKYQDAVTDYYRRLAELERVIGTPIGGAGERGTGEAPQVE
jgi:cobalt-zinc-cadmium efflux system outer membrane protein